VWGEGGGGQWAQKWPIEAGGLDNNYVRL